MCRITLDELVEVTQLDPCHFMGIVFEGQTCPPFTCSLRNIWVNALEEALDDFQTALSTIGESVCTTQETLCSRSPMFMIPENLRAVKKRTVRLTNQPVIQPTPGAGDDLTQWCRRKFTVGVSTTSINLLQHERVVDVRVVWPNNCACKRLGVQWCNPDFTIGLGNVITLEAFGYNFVDIDRYPECVAAGSETYLPSVTIEVDIESDSCAQVVWGADRCSCGCCGCTEPGATAPPGAPPDPLCPTRCPRNRVCELCVVRNGKLSLTVDGWQCTRPCDIPCLDDPIMFTLTVQRAGLWRKSWVRAALALAHNKLPYESCLPCHPISTLLYKQDTTVPDKTPPWQYKNGFGIYTPGARMAWTTIFAGVSETAVTTV